VGVGQIKSRRLCLVDVPAEWCVTSPGLGRMGSVRDQAGTGRRSQDMENPRGSDGLHQSREEGGSLGIPRRRSLATCRQGGGSVTERFSRHLARGWQPFLEHGLPELHEMHREGKVQAL
jgi:hypothetical protein